MKRNLILSIILTNILFMGCSCKKPTDVIPPDNYDPRNVSRNASKSYSGTLAVGSDGTVHVVWCDDAAGQFKTYYSSKPAVGSWTPAVDISGNTTNNCSAPQIAFDPSGNLHAVWDEQMMPSGSYCAYTNKPTVSSWTVPIDISGAPWGSLPQIGIDNVGKVYVVYDKGGGCIIYSKR